MAYSTTKKKTTKPAHVKPLTSSRWSGAKLSKTTEKKINDAYAKRKTARRKPAAKKVSEPKLSERTVQKINLAYRKRKKDNRAKRKTPKSQGEGWVQIDTSTTKYDTGWFQVQVYSLLNSEPQTIHQIGAKALEVASKKVGHKVQDSSVPHRVATCLNYLVKQGLVEVSKTSAGGFTKYSTITKARIDKLLSRYARAYDLLYSTRDLSNIGIPDEKYRSLVKAGRMCIETNPGVYKAFVKANRDAATSDRELAAYAWAWTDNDIPKASQIEPAKSYLVGKSKTGSQFLKDHIIITGIKR